MTRLFGIQYLRAAAAIGVVVFHAGERTGLHFAIGAAGVDVFFVVSGFIMWVIADRRQFSPSTFLRDRLERIAPLYWIATGVMVAGGLAGLFPNMRLTAWHVFASLAFVPHISPSNGEIWPLLVQGWTLNYEMFFYVVFAATLLLPQRMRLVSLGLVLVGLVACGMLARSPNPLLQTYTNPLILEFLLGAVIGKLWLDGIVPSPAVGIALILVSLAGFAAVGATYVGFNAFVLGPLAGGLVYGFLALERAAMLKRIPAVAYLGDASYSIYLWHALAVSVIAKFGALLALPAVITFTLAVLLGVAVGVASYELLERPLVRLLKARRRSEIVQPVQARMMR